MTCSLSVSSSHICQNRSKVVFMFVLWGGGVMVRPSRKKQVSCPQHFRAWGKHCEDEETKTWHGYEWWPLCKMTIYLLTIFLFKSSFEMLQLYEVWAPPPALSVSWYLWLTSGRILSGSMSESQLYCHKPIRRKKYERVSCGPVGPAGAFVACSHLDT